MMLSRSRAESTVIGTVDVSGEGRFVTRGGTDPFTRKMARLSIPGTSVTAKPWPWNASW